MSRPVDLLCFPVLGFELNEESTLHLMKPSQLDQSPGQHSNTKVLSRGLSFRRGASPTAHPEDP